MARRRRSKANFDQDTILTMVLWIILFPFMLIGYLIFTRDEESKEGRGGCLLAVLVLLIACSGFALGLAYVPYLFVGAGIVVSTVGFKSVVSRGSNRRKYRRDQRQAASGKSTKTKAEVHKGEESHEPKPVLLDPKKSRMSKIEEHTETLEKVQDEKKVREYKEEESQNKTTDESNHKTFELSSVHREPLNLYPSVQSAVEAYHIPQDYCKLVIDSIPNTDIKECPGLAWIDQGQFCLLPLFVNGSIYTWPVEHVQGMIRMVVRDVDSEEHYHGLYEAECFEEFEELMPEYTLGQHMEDTENMVLKNGVVVTAASGPALRKLLGIKDGW